MPSKAVTGLPTVGLGIGAARLYSHVCRLNSPHELQEAVTTPLPSSAQLGHRMRRRAETFRT